MTDELAPSQQLISSVRVEVVGGHERATVFNRGGNAGTLLVNIGDGEAIAGRLRGKRLEQLEGLYRLAMAWAKDDTTMPGRAFIEAIWACDDERAPWPTEPKS